MQNKKPRTGFRYILRGSDFKPYLEAIDIQGYISYAWTNRFLAVIDDPNLIEAISLSGLESKISPGNIYSMSFQRGTKGNEGLILKEKGQYINNSIAAIYKEASEKEEAISLDQLSIKHTEEFYSRIGIPGKKDVFVNSSYHCYVTRTLEPDSIIFDSILIYSKNSRPVAFTIRHLRD